MDVKDGIREYELKERRQRRRERFECECECWLPWRHSR
jgi:hypothetical protein